MTPFRLKYLAALVGIVFLSAVFISWSVHFVQSEHTIHSWDHILLWTMGAELASRAHHGVLSLIAGFGWSMHHDYNDLSVLPTAVAMTFGGTSRLCFVLANVIFLIIPSVILCWWLLVGVKLTTWPQTAAGVLSFVALLAVPLPWVVTMNGMTDVAGLIMACIATDLLIRTDIRSRRVETSVKVAGFRPWLRSLRDRFTSDGLSGGVARGLAQPPATSLAKEAFLQRSQVIRWLAIGAAMALTALSKRWFLYLVIGQMAVLWVETGLEIIAASRRSRSITLSSIGAAIYGPFLCVCGLVGVYFLSFPLPFKILTTDYSTIFAAYQTSDSWLSQIVDNLGHIVQQFGIAQTVLSFLCFVAALFFTQARRAAIYLYVPALAAWADFSKVQNMAEQHILLVYIALAVTPLFLAQQLLSAKLPAGKAWGWSVLALMVLISCLSFESVFASAPPLGSSFVQAMLPTYRKPPAQRHDIAELEALMNFVGDKVATASGQPPVADVYLLSSSQLLNSSHLSTLGLQLNEVLPAGDHICLTNDVDLRDGFPNLLLSAKVVLVADPVQTHLAADQKVISVPVRMFLQDEAFAHAFTRDPHSFQLDDGVRVYAFERVRPSTPEEIDQLRREIGVPSKKNPAKIEQ